MQCLTIEIAITADGVNPGKGSDLTYRKLEADGGVDRAMKMITDLCTDPNGGCVFWNAGAQPPELLANGEVVMATGWNGRFFQCANGRNSSCTSMGWANS